MPGLAAERKYGWYIFTQYKKLLSMYRMPLENRDASQIAIKNRMKMLYAWKSVNTIAVNFGGSVLKEQPTYQSAEVVAMRRQGGCKCSADASENPYQFNGLSQCGCGA